MFVTAFKNTGNCFICGKTIGKAAGKTYVIKEHGKNGTEECTLIKVEGAYDKDYWLFVDIPMNESLGDLDFFLREIWLECCGHMSMFSKGKHRNGTFTELEQDLKINYFSIGNVLDYKYDMGDTTRLIISFVGKTRREEQKAAVRLLLRNAPFTFPCVACKEQAVYACGYCSCVKDDYCYCAKCGKEHENDCDGRMFTIPNSPRFGQCAYDGTQDIHIFNPFAKSNC